MLVSPVSSATTNLFVSNAKPPSREAREVTDKVLDSVDAPVTPKVLDSVVAPVTPKVLDSVAALVTDLSLIHI